MGRFRPRWLLKNSEPNVTALTAIEIATRFAAEYPWIIKDPRAYAEEGAWLVRLNSDLLNSSWVRVSTDSGNILEFGQRNHLPHEEAFTEARDSAS